jgi:hypothetical protein
LDRQIFGWEPQNLDFYRSYVVCPLIFEAFDRLSQISRLLERTKRRKMKIETTRFDGTSPIKSDSVSCALQRFGQEFASSVSGLKAYKRERIPIQSVLPVETGVWL